MALESVRENDVKRVQEKYECLLFEIKERVERAEKKLDEKEKEWLNKELNWTNKENGWLSMFKDLYSLSKTGEMA
jgi:hypothetical protein